MNSTENTPGQPDAAPGQPTPGQMLRAARQAKGLHLAVLSVTLKVPTQQLEALENDQYDAFKGVAFVRALAQSLCRQLGIDPGPVLAGLPKTGAPRSIAPKAIDAGVPAAPQGLGGLRGKGPSRPVLLLAVLMLGVSAALLWWPKSETLPTTPAAQDVSEPGAVPMGQANDPVETPAATAASEPPVVAPAAPPVTPPVAPPVAPPSEAPAAKPPAPAAVTPPVVAPSPAVPATSQAPAGDMPLVIQPTVDTWIEVRDGRGQMAVKRMVKSGEVLQLEVPLPLFVYVGRADTTTLSWRGKAVDLKPHTTHNEARLQIKP